MTLPEAVELVRRALLGVEGGEVIVPKLPSYSVWQLGNAIWAEHHEGEAPFLAVGLRPGEKLHETLLSEDEAPWARDCGDHYKVLHQIMPGPGGRQAASEPEGEPLRPGFSYRSDRNVDNWLYLPELRERLRGV